MSFVELDGINTYYSVSGNGSPLVLIHHLAGNTKSWFNQIPYLSQNYQVIAYDLRGHGRSAESNQAFTIDNLADDLFLLLQELGISNCSLIGHSIGGMIAPLFALKHGSMINSLILIAGTSQPLAQDKLVSYRSMREIARTKGMEALAEYRRANGHIPPKIANDTILWEHFKKSTKKHQYRVTLECRKHLQVPNLTNELSELHCPILGVVGDLDPVFIEMMKILSENAKVSLRIMHDRGHFAMMEEPDEFNKIIANFLNTYNLK